MSSKLSGLDVAHLLGMKQSEVTSWDGTTAVLLDGTEFELDGTGRYRMTRCPALRDTAAAARSRALRSWQTAPVGAAPPTAAELDDTGPQAAEPEPTPDPDPADSPPPADKPRPARGGKTPAS
jgi:hypothetical protein